MTKRKLIDADELLKGLYDENPKDVALYIANFPEASCMNPEKMHDTDALISRQAAREALQKEIDKAIPPYDDVFGAIRAGVRLARNIIEDLPSVQPEENCDTCKHGYFGGEMCNNCRVGYPSNYERRTDGV